MKNNYDFFIGGLKPNCFLPDKQLYPFVKRYLFFEGELIDTKAEMHSVSNGLVEICIHFDKSHIILCRNNHENRLNNYIIGMYNVSKPKKVLTCSAGCSISGMVISLTFKGVYCLLKTKLLEFSNNVITLEELWGYKGKCLFEQVIEASDNQKRALILDKFFLNILNDKKEYGFLKLDCLLNLVNEKNQRVTMGNLIDCLNISYRTLNRKFHDEVGLCPKEYLKTIRFDKVCRMISISKRISVPEILYYGGYYDQAHFIHEFKEIMKITPAKLLRISEGNFYITRGILINDSIT